MKPAKKPAKRPPKKPRGAALPKASTRTKPRRVKAPPPRVRATPKRLGVSLQAAKLDVLRGEIERQSAALPRWNANPDDVQRSVAQLVLALVEFLRKLLERQAIRRMEGETLDPEEVERIGLALMRLEQTVHEMASRFGLDPSELNLDLGPLGRLV